MGKTATADPYAGIAEDPYASISEDHSDPQAEANRIAGLIKQAKEKNKPTGFTGFLKDPRGFLQQRQQELAKEAQNQQNQYLGVEGEADTASQTTTLGKGASYLRRFGHGVMSLLPETGAVVDKVAAGLMDWKTAAAFVASKIDPALGAAAFATMGAHGVQQTYQKVLDGTATPDESQDFLLSLAQIFGAAGEAAKGPEVVKKGGETTLTDVSKPGEMLPAREPGLPQTNTGRAARAVVNAPETIRKGAQIVAGIGPERTTKPMLEEFQKDRTAANEKQTAENTKVEQDNRAAAEDFQTKKREALRKQQELTDEHTLATEEVKSRNEAAKEQSTRRGDLARNINQGSGQLGQRIQTLEKNVKSEGDAKYNAIKEKLAKDEGVPAADLAEQVKSAVDQHVKGSPESIRQVSDIVRKAGEDAGQSVTLDGREYTPQTDPAAWQNIVEQGLAPEGTSSIPFKDLQGYSSEIGRRLSQGNLPGDVYQALKAVKEIIDRQKMEIAKRNGVAGELGQADAFWRKYMETFYDKPNAVAETLERVGKLDPEFYAEPFLKGKTTNTAVGKLQSLEGANAGEANAIADHVQNLRTMNDEMKTLPKEAKPETLPNPKAPVAQPQKPEFSNPKEIEQPTMPTEEDIVTKKKEELAKAAREVGRMTKYDAAIIASSIIAAFSGHPWYLLADPGALAIRRGIAQVISKPKVVEWLAKPSDVDIEILRKFPEEAKVAVGENLRKVVDTERSHGNDVVIDPKLADALKWPANYRNSPKAMSAAASQGGANYSAEDLAALKARHGIKDVQSEQVGAEKGVKTDENGIEPAGGPSEAAQPHEVQAAKERLQFLKQRLKFLTEQQKKGVTNSTMMETIARDRKTIDDLEQWLENPRTKLVSRGREIVEPD